MIRVAVRNHQNKADGLLVTLSEIEGVQLVPFGAEADVLLIDHDGTQWYDKVITGYKRAGARVLLYTHGAPGWCSWDGIHEPHPLVDGYLAQTPGEREVMRRYGYPKPVAVTGWYWCEQRKFKKWDGKERARVLFAPIHTLNNGRLHEDVYKLNKLVLHTLASKPNIGLTVRYIGDMKNTGIEHINGVAYKQGHKNNGVTDIDNHDFVVSYGTFLHLAVARGKPVLGYRYDLPVFDYVQSVGTEVFAAKWHLYSDFMRYPYDVIEDELSKANKDPEHWRATWVGDQITKERLKRCLITLIPTAKPKLLLHTA